MDTEGISHARESQKKPTALAGGVGAEAHDPIAELLSGCVVSADRFTFLPAVETDKNQDEKIEDNGKYQ
jgi:hypothetical protein